MHPKKVHLFTCTEHSVLLQYAYVTRGRILESNWEKSLKLVCNVNIVYGNLKSENSQDYAQKPQRICTFMNSVSVLDLGKYSNIRSVEWYCIAAVWQKHWQLVDAGSWQLLNISTAAVLYDSWIVQHERWWQCDSRWTVNRWYRTIWGMQKVTDRWQLADSTTAYGQLMDSLLPSEQMTAGRLLQYVLSMMRWFFKVFQNDIELEG